MVTRTKVHVTNAKGRQRKLPAFCNFGVDLDTHGTATIVDDMVSLSRKCVELGVWFALVTTNISGCENGSQDVSLSNLAAASDSDEDVIAFIRPYLVGNEDRCYVDLKLSYTLCANAAGRSGGNPPDFAVYNKVVNGSIDVFNTALPEGSLRVPVRERTDNSLVWFTSSFNLSDHEPGLSREVDQRVGTFEFFRTFGATRYGDAVIVNLKRELADVACAHVGNDILVKRVVPVARALKTMHEHLLSELRKPEYCGPRWLVNEQALRCP